MTGVRSPACGANEEPGGDEEGVARFQGIRESAQPEQQLTTALLVEVKPPRRRAPGNRAAEIDEVAISVRPCADHRVRKHDGVRFAPGNLLAERRAEAGLVGSAGERRLAPQLLVCLHQPGSRHALRRRHAHQLRMDQIDGTDVERRRDANAATAADQPVHEVEAHLAVVQAAIDVRARDVEQRPGAYRSRERGEHLHREGGGRPLLSMEHRVVVGGQMERHSPGIIPFLSAASGGLTLAPRGR